MSRASSLCFAIGTDHFHKRYHRVASQRAHKTHFGLWPPPPKSTDGHWEGLLIARGSSHCHPSLFLSFFSFSFLYHSLFVCFLLSISVPHALSLSLSPMTVPFNDGTTNCLQTFITKRASNHNALWRDTLYVEHRRARNTTNHITYVGPWIVHEGNATLMQVDMQFMALVFNSQQKRVFCYLLYSCFFVVPFVNSCIVTCGRGH